MKTDNFINGSYFAELTHELLASMESDPHNTKTEFRVSIYGRKANEWERLAAWIDTHAIYSDCNRFLIQVPRLFDTWKKLGFVKSFQEMLDNIFRPLFLATIDPGSHKQINRALTQISGFDSVDDESKADLPMPPPGEGDPAEWTGDQSPPYAVWCYYMFANITEVGVVGVAALLSHPPVCFQLNKLRRKRGLHEFSFRPHAGEAGSWTHLADTYLLATNINHGQQ